MNQKQNKIEQGTSSEQASSGLRALRLTVIIPFTYRSKFNLPVQPFDWINRRALMDLSYTSDVAKCDGRSLATGTVEIY